MSAALVVSGARADTADDPGLEIVSREAGGRVTIIARLRGMSDVTVNLTLHLKNMNCTRRLPANAVLLGEGDHPLATLVGHGSMDKWEWPYACDYFVGHRPTKLPGTWYYRLPYDGARYEVILGPYGLPSHGPGTGNEEAVDFGMPEGSKILAARGGTVVAVRSDRISGGVGASFTDDGNHVVIRHSDGTYAQYAHCKYHGVLVKAGQVVAAGQSIAICGHTGYAEGPHLHFSVYYPVSATKCVTIPLIFRTPAGFVKPEEGHYY